MGESNNCFSKKIIETKHLALGARFKFFFADKTIQFVTGGL